MDGRGATNRFPLCAYSHKLYRAAAYRLLIHSFIHKTQVGCFIHKVSEIIHGQPTCLQGGNTCSHQFELTLFNRRSTAEEHTEAGAISSASREKFSIIIDSPHHAAANNTFINSDCRRDSTWNETKVQKWLNQNDRLGIVITTMTKQCWFDKGNTRNLAAGLFLRTFVEKFF